MLRRAFFTVAVVVLLPSTVEAFDHHHHHSSHGSGCSSSHASSSSSTSTPTASPSPASTSAPRDFITSTAYSGAVGGIGPADRFCQASADAAGLPGTYRAWISTTQVRASGAAPDIANLLDEHGAVPSSPDAWTGSEGNTCDDWIDGTSEVTGDVLDRTGATTAIGCDHKSALICLAQ